MKKRNTGITLIALVITIIVLLILAGIVISLTIGENGMINKAKESGLAYDEQQAKEKLELVLLDMQADKVTNSEYNQNEYLTKEIEENSMIVNGDIVFLDGWQFQIDRSIPEVSISLGKGQVNENIKLNVGVTASSDYTKSVIKVEIEYVGEIKYISIAGEEIVVPEKIDDKYIVEKEVTANGNYGVIVKDIEDTYQIANVAISDLVEDMEIYTKEDLERFRDNVNSGRTYEGKTIKVMNDIDLQGSETNQWIPIGNFAESTNLYFAGTFAGNNHAIGNIYINSSQNYRGLFGENRGNISGVRLVNGTIISNNYMTGGIVGRNNGKIENCYNGANISLQGTQDVGGIAGRNGGIINNCYNAGIVTSGTNNTGGITGVNLMGKISNCYNIGKVKGNAQTGGIAGSNFGTGGNHDATLSNCYNIGSVTGGAYVGSISGHNGVNSTYVGGTIENCYYISGAGIGTSYSYIKNEVFVKTQEELKNIAMQLGNSFTTDFNNINNGYPILKWQVE